MRVILVPVALGLAVAVVFLSATPAPAAGCLKGAVVGGVAGHYAGHHGLLGAGAGCVIGRLSTRGNAPSKGEAMIADIREIGRLTTYVGDDQGAASGETE